MIVIIASVVAFAVVSFLVYKFVLASPTKPEPSKNGDEAPKKPGTPLASKEEKDRLRERLKQRHLTFQNKIEKKMEEATCDEPKESKPEKSETSETIQTNTATEKPSEIQAGGAPEKDVQPTLSEVDKRESLRNILMNPGGPEDVVAFTTAMAATNRNKNSRKFISSSRVNEVWKKHRGDQKGPGDDMINKAIAKSAKSQDGAIKPYEMERFTTAFLRHSGEKMEGSQLFDLLDENLDGVLTFEEVRTAFKAMWLMKKNGVKLSDLMVERQD